MAWTLAEIKQFLKDNDRDDSSARGLRQYVRIANDANMALHGLADWPWDRTLHRLVAKAKKTDGTVSVNAEATALTGVATLFAATDVGSYFRLNGEAQQYRMTAYGGTALLATIQTYRGASNLAGVTYALTDERLALPARFRAFDMPDDGVLGPLEVISLDELLYERLHGRATGIPDRCAIEEASDPADSTGAAPASYLWIYPAPDDKTIFDLPVYLWPAEMTSDTHGISAPSKADRAYREFLLAYLFREQKNEGAFANQLEYAGRIARQDLGNRPRKEMGQRRMWTPEGEASRRVHITEVREG